MKTITPTRNTRASTMLTGRQYAIEVDGAKVVFECERERHRYAVNFGSKRLPVSRRMSPSACKLMASWWSREKGGSIGSCPECES